MRYLALILLLSGCLGPHVRAPKSDVRFVHSIGWWSYQKDLKINDFRVAILDSRLNLLNSKTLVQIEISGEMKGQGGWHPFIGEVHLSEKVLRQGNFITPSEAEIVVTPIVDVKKDKSYREGSIPFSIKQEIILNSMAWGKNTFTIMCGDMKQSVSVTQDK